MVYRKQIASQSRIPSPLGTLGSRLVCDGDQINPAGDGKKPRALYEPMATRLEATRGEIFATGDGDGEGDLVAGPSWSVSNMRSNQPNRTRLF